jgi:ligand-binding SRPBCC domain-containing protein
MRFKFHSEQLLPYSPEIVFAFFANPENLPRLMPNWQCARIEEATIKAPPPRPATARLIGSVAAGAGTRLTMSFRPFPYAPFRLPWEAEIAEFVWNDHFCDHQLRGPFAYWNHCHAIVPQTSTDASGVARPGSLLQDAVEYEVPFGMLGRIARRLFIKRQLEATFAYRKHRAAALLLKMAGGSRT